MSVDAAFDDFVELFNVLLEADALQYVSSLKSVRRYLEQHPCGVKAEQETRNGPWTPKVPNLDGDDKLVFICISTALLKHGLWIYYAATDEDVVVSELDRMTWPAEFKERIETLIALLRRD